MKCPNCEIELTQEDAESLATCPFCGADLPDKSSVGEDSPAPEPAYSLPPRVSESQASGRENRTDDAGPGLATKLGQKLTTMAGVEKLEGFSLSTLFSDVFAKHTTEEIEASFIVGTPSTTPPLSQVDTSWPRPWLFLRSLFWSILLYVIFTCSMHEFSSFNLLPGMVFVGSFAVPISTLVFFMEINVVRNVSLLQIIRLVLFGGIVSLVLSLFIYQLPFMESMSWIGASVAGLAEEPGKLLAVVAVVSSARYPYKVNGLLFGAAVGTGFAAFESAGYAFTYLLNSEDVHVMENVILVRGLLSPLGHIVWSAIAGAALWRIKKDRKFKFSMMGDPKFLRLFILSIVLHMIWNSPLNLPFYGKYILVGLVGWTIVLALLQEGLRELRDLKTVATISH